MDSCKATAPSSTANLGPGFDTFGLALDLFIDEIRINKKENQNKKITISTIKQEEGRKIPFDNENNSAALVVDKMMEEFKINDNIEIEIIKGVPPGYGLGSSAASSVAAAYAFNKLYNLKIDPNELINYAAEGERASAGIKHYDNVASSMLGGFIIVRTTPLLEIIKFDPPEDLYLIVGIPKIIVPKKKTQAARGLLPLSFPLENIVTNISNASTIVAGFANNDVEMIAKGIDDKIVEPVRKKMIPGFDNVKQKALHAGALAVTISGAGPSVISILKTAKHSNNIIEAIKEGFAESKIQSEVYICKPSDGVKIKSI
ncbi:MAG TPA: homoserine kinase [Nitrososphaeraceae archaeon]|nr:homoserine kinase [Nitrososphaeraceae archaeon]